MIEFLFKIVIITGLGLVAIIALAYLIAALIGFKDALKQLAPNAITIAFWAVAIVLFWPILIGAFVIGAVLGGLRYLLSPFWHIIRSKKFLIIASVLYAVGFVLAYYAGSNKTMAGLVLSLPFILGFLRIDDWGSVTKTPALNQKEEGR